MPETYPMAFITAPGKVEFQQCTLPDLGPRDVLIQVRASAICGSDLHLFKGRHPFAPLPVAAGHEIAGQVLEIGPQVSLVSPGDRVAVEPVIACGECHFCLIGEYHRCLHISFQYRQGQGGFTPYFIAHERWLHQLPASLSYAEGALLEPLSVAVHAVGRAGFQPGASSAIFGDGAIGLFMLLVIKHTGGGETFIAGIQPHRLELARQMGASAAINSLEEDPLPRILQATSGMGVERAFEAVGIEPTLVQALESLRKGGTAVLVGLFEQPLVSIPANLFIQKEITLSGSQGYCWDFQRAIRLIEQQGLRYGQMITHRLPLESIQEGFELLLDPANRAVKVVVTID
jgi:2-desacetyl-2-hydroxyethyl bacteriochlorophyllide A dehydrogenase